MAASGQLLVWKNMPEQDNRPTVSKNMHVKFQKKEARTPFVCQKLIYAFKKERCLYMK